MTVDPEGRVGVFTRARWPVMVAAWLIAVVLITLLTSRVIHVVGRQLSSTVSLPHPHAAGQPAVVPTEQTTPTAPNSRRRSPPPSAQSTTQATSQVGTTGSVLGTATSKSRPPVSSPAVHRPVPGPKVTRPAPPPPVVTDQRTVQTAGGQAAFTCTSSDRLSLLYATPAPGYAAEPPRVRSSSRMDVTFAGPQDQKIDARCSDGHLQADVEV